MSRSSSRTVPSAQARGTVSCMRLRQRRNVDLPQPEGPITAVTWRSGMSRVTSRMAVIRPKPAESCSTRTRGGTAMAGARSPRISIVATVEPAAGGQAGENADREDEEDEDEGSGPGQGMPFVIGADRIVEYLQRDRGDRLVQPDRPELVAEGGEEQRRGLTGDARDGDQDAGNDTA